MTINEMSKEQRIKERSEFRALFEWIKENTPYNDMNIDNLLAESETWWNEICFQMTPEELLELCRSGVK